MNCLVTGGAGFIGSHIAEGLLERGASVRILDNFSTGRRENIDTLIHRFKRNRVSIIEGDIREGVVVGEAIRGISTVFHAAAFVSVPQSMEDPQTCFDVNAAGTSLLLDAARSAGVRRVVIASSAAVYGESPELPLREDSSLHPKSPYAVSKRVNELYAELYTRTLGLDVVALRYFNVYGPRQRPDSMYAAAVPIFVRRLLHDRPITVFGDGGQTRDLINVRDVVRANLLAAEHLETPGRVFNVCTGVETRLLDLVDVLYRLLPSAPQAQFAAARAGDIYRSVGSPTKAIAYKLRFLPDCQGRNRAFRGEFQANFRAPI